MKILKYYIAVALCFALSFFAKGQEHIEVSEKTGNDGSFHKSQYMMLSADTSEMCTSSDTLVHNRLTKLKQSLQHSLDSLKQKGTISFSLQEKSDSLNLTSSLPSEKYKALLALDQQLTSRIKNKALHLDTLLSVTNSMNKTNVQAVSTELRIGPLGKDLKVSQTLQHPVNSLLPSNVDPSFEIPSLGAADGMDANVPKVKIPGTDFAGPTSQLSGKVADLQNQTGKINEVVQQAGDVTQNADGYTKEIKTIKEEGLAKTEKLPELAEQQAVQLEEVEALKAQEAVSTKQLEEYKKLIEQYKEEKRIHEELKEKTKELATEKITANQGKVNDAMKKIGKYKRKFSQVHDMRNLPKHAPNPMKDKSWRERVVPGLTFQTFSSNATWLEFDPQVYYKLNGNLSAGIGGMYRFSMNPGKFTFDDFGSMSGAKIFAQYHVMKGFFVRGEGQYVRWKPWDLKQTDPNYIDHTFVAAAGIGKSYQIAKKLKGNIQTLYHFHWEGMDPYKPKVMIRIGFDFSLKKREEKHWEKRLKERKQELKK